MHNGNSIKFIAGNSHPELAQAIADRMGVIPTPCSVQKFSNGETGVRIHESVRDEDVFILQTSSGPDVNDFLMELLILISACKTASARRITAIIPSYPYARNAQKDKSRAPITAKLVANMLAVAGCDHVITMDLHASQIQGFFDMPVDNLYSEPLFVGFIKRFIPGFRNGIIVSPDAGGAKRASAIADKLGIDFALVHRSRKGKRGGTASGAPSRQESISWSSGYGGGRESPPMSAGYNGGYNSTGGSSAGGSLSGSLILEKVEEKMDLLVGDVSGRIAILVDDMIDTGETVKLAANCLKDNGAVEVWVLVSHGLIQDMTILESLPIERLVVTNSIPQRQHLPTAPPTPSGDPHEFPGFSALNGKLSPPSPSGPLDGEAGATPRPESLLTGALKRMSLNTNITSKKPKPMKNKLTVLDISPILAESIRRTHNGESISLLFGDWAERAAFHSY